MKIPHELAKYAATCGISLDDFRDQFYYIIENDLLYKNIENGKISLGATATETNKAFQPMPQGQSNNDDNGNDLIPH